MRSSGDALAWPPVRASGSAVDDEVREMAGVGRFGWVTDPEGRRIELWQPA
jgi:predicted enzyme related to lactoylglutathione lyase